MIIVFSSKQWLGSENILFYSRIGLVLSQLIFFPSIGNLHSSQTLYQFDRNLK